ncbi:MAG: hydroxymethylglutaryl-CoA lyase [Candidatus Velthaea sp.]
MEVGTRDGFQMEDVFIPTATKIAVLNDILATGVRKIEATSFVSPRAVPQMRDSAEVMAGVRRSAGTKLVGLVPNAKGAARAAEARVDEMAIFVSASESHNRANLNSEISATLDGFDAVAAIARTSRIALHGAIAVAFGCPFEGDVSTDRVVAIAERLLRIGVTGLTLGDTTGMATPRIVRDVCSALLERWPELPISLHFHNTRGLALVNVAAGLELGIDTYESSIGGLGGCPFAPGATGNVCTEDLVNFMHESGVETGIDLDALIATAQHVERVIGRTLSGQVMKAGPRLRLTPLEGQRCAVG